MKNLLFVLWNVDNVSIWTSCSFPFAVLWHKFAFMLLLAINCANRFWFLIVAKARNCGNTLHGGLALGVCSFRDGLMRSFHEEAKQEFMRKAKISLKSGHYYKTIIHVFLSFFKLSIWLSRATLVPSMLVVKRSTQIYLVLSTPC